jgi:hypothetical protein
MSTLGAGCSATAPAPTVSGKTLTVYLSAPSSLSSDPQAQGVIAAEKLAFTQLSGQVKGFTLKLRVVTSNKISDNARSAIEDKTSVAYLGEITPGTSRDSLGITNAQELLQVSPAAAAAVPTSDFESFSTYGRTFASMAPNSDQAAQAILGEPGGKSFSSGQAVLGYAAMAGALKALQKAGSAANNRGTVRDAFFALKGAQLVAGSGGAVLGTYTVNKGGSVTITPGSGSTTP